MGAYPGRGNGNNRRKLLVALGAGTFVTPLACFSQQRSGKTWWIGVLVAETASSYQASRVDAVRNDLRELGYVEGRTIIIE